MDTLITVAQFLLSLSILIILHECGHFFPARWFKTRVEKFFLFFDPGFSLFEFKKGETRYGIGWLPLGGYVKISGMIDESFDKDQMAGPPQPWEFRSKPAWQRLIIMLGGVTVNFILAVLVFGLIIFHWGEEYIPTENIKYGIYVQDLGEQVGLQNGDFVIAVGNEKIDEFNPLHTARKIIIDEAKSITVMRDGRELKLPVSDEVRSTLTKFENSDKVLYGFRIPVTVGEIAADYPADRAGLNEGDKIIQINETKVEFHDEYRAAANQLKNQKANITVIREVDTLELQTQFDSAGRLGFVAYGADYYFDSEKRTYDLGTSIVKGFHRTTGFISDQMKAFGQMITGKINPSDSLGSFITIGKMYGPAWDWKNFWSMTAMLSALLGFVNLLPIPGLDGGHVMFLIYEVITSKKPSDRVLEYSTMAGFLLLMSVMIYALGLDIVRHI